MSREFNPANVAATRLWVIVDAIVEAAALPADADREQHCRLRMTPASRPRSWRVSTIRYGRASSSPGELGEILVQLGGPGDRIR